MSEPRAAGSIEGHCLCGAVSIHVAQADDVRPDVCRCRRCQRWSGLLFCRVFAPADTVSVSGEIARYASSGFVERAFASARLAGDHRRAARAEHPFVGGEG